MGGLAEELKKRAEDEPAAAPETFVLIHGLQNFKKLRQEDEFSFSSSDAGGAANPAAVLRISSAKGPAHGFHVIATCDTYNNVNRFLGRKTLSEFEMRVLFQMSASDSASLIDAPDASTLGLHRALYYNDREGYIETFRPYALPGNDWIEEVANNNSSDRWGNHQVVFVLRPRFPRCWSAVTCHRFSKRRRSRCRPKFPGPGFTRHTYSALSKSRTSTLMNG